MKNNKKLEVAHELSIRSIREEIIPFRVNMNQKPLKLSVCFGFSRGKDRKF